jgi:4-hydroxybenzoate polyprenyltransferase
MIEKKDINFTDKIKAFLRVSRANLLVASFGHATLGMFLGAMLISELFRIEVPLYIALHYSIAFFACNINCYFDYEVDKRYKKYMSNSVEIISKSKLKLIIVIEFLIAIILIILFFILGYSIISFLAIIGLIGAYSYSAEPFRIKKHGIISPLPILILYTLPIVGGWLIFRTVFSLVIIIFLIGYVLMNEGFTLVNVCEDYAEDKKEKIITWAHYFGLKKTLLVAFLFSISGLLCTVAMGLKLYNNFNGIIHLPALIMIFASTALIIKASFEVGEVYKSKDPETKSKEYGKRLQKWFLITRYPLILTAIFILL